MNTNLNTPSNNQYEGIDVFLSSKEYLKYCIFKSILQGIVMLIGFIAGIVLMAIVINNAEELIKSLENFLINNNFDYTLEFDSSSSEISFTSDSSLFTIGSIACMWFLYSFAKNKKKTNWPFQVLYAINLIIFIGSCISLCLLLLVPAGLFALHSFANLNSELLILVYIISAFIIISIIINFIYSLFKMKTFKKLDKGFIKEVEYIPEANKVKKTSYFKIGINLCQLISLIVLFNLLKTGVIFDNLSSLNIKELIELLKLFMPIINIFITFFIISKITNILSLLFDIKLINNYHYFVKNKRKININNTNNNEFDFI